MTEPVAASSTRPARPRRLRRLYDRLRPGDRRTSGGGGLLRLGGGEHEVNLAQYKRIHRYALPLPPGTPAPANSLLAEEASGVTYDPVTETLFVVGDGGTSVVQVDKEGHLLNSMTLAPERQPAGHDLLRHRGHRLRRPGADGEAELVITEERESKLDRFTYVAGGELHPGRRENGDDRHRQRQHRHRGRHQRPAEPGPHDRDQRIGPGADLLHRHQLGSRRPRPTSKPKHRTGELFPASDVGTLDFSDVYALANVPGISRGRRIETCW